MYALFGRVASGYPFMRDVLSQYVRESGRAIIMDNEKQKDHLALVQQLLDMKENSSSSSNNNIEKETATANESASACEIRTL